VTDGGADRETDGRTISGDNDMEADTGVDGGSHPWDDHSLVVMTFNVMCSFCSNSSGGNDKWDARVPDFGDIITRHAPDLVGLQELTYPSEVDQILAVAPGYQAIYAKKLPKNSVGLNAYPDAIILYRADRFEVVESGHYWLSPTPDTDWSGGWSTTGATWRIIDWVRLQQVSDGRTFIFQSTHFDNNPPNQPNSAALVIQRTEQWDAAYPIIFVGDFNSQPVDPAYVTLATGIDGKGFHFQNAYDLAGGTYAVVTNLSPEPTYDPSGRIDHIWVAGSATWTASDWKVDMTVYGAHQYYPSDHFPIVSTLKW
jgi:endonuclease/exonuclease/phosphatase family metal-dependent hydrolase